MKREKVKIDNIPYATVFDNGVGYVSLGGFTKGAASELKEKLVSFRAGLLKNAEDGMEADFSL